MKCGMLLQPVCMLKLMLNLLSKNVFKGEDSTLLILGNMPLTLACIWMLMN